MSHTALPCADSAVQPQLLYDGLRNLAEHAAARVGDQFGVPSVSLVPQKTAEEMVDWIPNASDHDAMRMFLASRIDHTRLRPDVTHADLTELCDEARRFRFATVCVNGVRVRTCHELLAGSTVGVCCVVGFPLGANTTAAKSFEAREAVQAGASEIDTVLNIGALKDSDYQTVREDIREVVRAARGARVKVILETAILSDEEKIVACMLSRLAGAHFVKTSSGYGPAGATPRDVALLRWAVGRSLGVKAAGGIRTREAALQMLRAGADRIGTSAGAVIVTVGSEP